MSIRKAVGEKHQQRLQWLYVKYIKNKMSIKNAVGKKHQQRLRI